MELVVQVWCPLEDSPNDRALYVWACSRGVCQGLAGRYAISQSLRVARAHRLCSVYVPGEAYGLTKSMLLD